MSSLKELHARVHRLTVLKVSLSAIMAGIVYAFTIVFSLYIPQTRGFFNFGEVGVYISALVGGPFIGFIAGAVGSSLADITLGYHYYAPATFIIKGIEGLIVGYLSEIFEVGHKDRLTYFSGGISVVAIAFLMYIFGTHLYIGSAEITLAMGILFTVTFNEAVWLVTSIVFGIVTIYLTLRYIEISGWIVAMAIGGLEMVLGYYLYEQYILGYIAIAEVPFNIMQALIGIFGATIVTHYIRKLRL